MQEAAMLLGIDVNTSHRSDNVPCPVCSKLHREKKLNINFEKEVFRCAKCGISGGPIKLWGLYKGISDPKEAALDYYKFIEGNGKGQRDNYAPVPVERNEAADVASIDVRDSTFKQLLELLTLNNEHYENLHKRGLTDEQIEKGGYKSYPLAGRQTLATMLQGRGCILKGVPGFYQDDADNWTLRRLGSGFIIPQRDGFGRIQGLQVRMDKGDVRYLTLSTDNYRNGAKGYAYIHLAKGEKGLDEIIVTEGPLKGDIISNYTGYSVLALQGVNSTSRLDFILMALKEKGTKKIYTAFDMDMTEKESVREAMYSLERKIEAAGIVYQQIIWDPEYKGLDDWLASK